LFLNKNIYLFGARLHSGQVASKWAILVKSVGKWANLVDLVGKWANLVISAHFTPKTVGKWANLVPPKECACNN
jgi:hypothetical protein